MVNADWPMGLIEVGWLFMSAVVGSERVGWIDTAKGMAMLLVVLWHSYLIAQLTGDFPSWLVNVNNALNIRMAPFFVASGLLMVQVVEQPWITLLRKRVAPMTWILLLWTVIGSAFDSITPLYPWEDEPAQSLVQVPWLPQGNLWFVYALILFTLLARLTASVSGWRRPVLAVGLWLILVAYDAWRGEFHTRNMVQYFPFFMAGLLVAPWIRRATASGRGLATITAICLAGLAALLLADVDGMAGTLGRYVCGAGLFVTAAAFVQPWSWITSRLDAVGRNSLPIYLGHMPVIALAFAVLPLGDVSSVAIWLVLFVLGVSGALLLRTGAHWLGLDWLYKVPEPMVDRLGAWLGGTSAPQPVYQPRPPAE